MVESKIKNNVIDYLRWRGDLTFYQDPFNEADNLVLCIIAYLNFSRFPESKTMLIDKSKDLGFFAERMTAEDDQLGLSELSYLPVIQEAAKTRRYKHVKLFAYDTIFDKERAIQFQAISFIIPDHSVYCAFMGTDRSFAGWKEDFNLSYQRTVPSHTIALEYAIAISGVIGNRKLRIGGHSKGGNLASYTAINMPVEIQDNIVTAYNNDGPGFIESYELDEKYERIKGRLFTFIPESSIVGVLLNHSKDYTVIASANDSIMQHESMSWQIQGNHFIRLEKRSESGMIAEEALKKWVYGLTEDERKRFVDILFDILSAGGKIETLDELRAKGLTGKIEMIKRYEAADQEDKLLLNKVWQTLQLDLKEEIFKTNLDLNKLFKQNSKLIDK